MNKFHPKTNNRPDTSTILKPLVALKNSFLKINLNLSIKSEIHFKLSLSVQLLKTYSYKIYFRFFKTSFCYLDTLIGSSFEFRLIIYS